MISLLCTITAIAGVFYRGSERRGRTAKSERLRQLAGGGVIAVRRRAGCRELPREASTGVILQIDRLAIGARDQLEFFIKIVVVTHHGWAAVQCRRRVAFFLIHGGVGKHMGIAARWHDAGEIGVGVKTETLYVSES